MLEKTCKAVLMKLLANLAISPPLDGICVGPASAYFFHKKKQKQTNVRKKKTSLPLFQFTEWACAAVLHWDGAASTMWLFSIGMDNKIWTGRTFSSALMLQRRRQWRSRREEIGRGSVRNGPIGCNLAESSLSTPNAVQSNIPRDEPLQTSAGFNKVLNPLLCSELIGPVVRLHVKSSRYEWRHHPWKAGKVVAVLRTVASPVAVEVFRDVHSFHAGIDKCCLQGIVERQSKYYADSSQNGNNWPVMSC